MQFMLHLVDSFIFIYQQLGLNFTAAYDLFESDHERRLSKLVEHLIDNFDLFRTSSLALATSEPPSFMGKNLLNMAVSARLESLFGSLVKLKCFLANDDVNAPTSFLLSQTDPMKPDAEGNNCLVSIFNDHFTHADCIRICVEGRRLHEQLGGVGG